MSTFGERVIGAARLRVSVFEEVEADQTATMQAMAVVVLASIAGGIGLSTTGTGLVETLNLTLASLIAWVVWAALTYVLGARLFPEPQTSSNVGELLRTTGFSAAPGLLRVLGVVPGLGVPIYIATGIWMLASMVVAVRQALDYESTARAIGVCFVGWLLSTLLAVAIGVLIDPTVQ